MSSNKKIKTSLENTLSKKEMAKQNIQIIDDWAKGDGNCTDLTEYLNINEWNEWHRRKIEGPFNTENLKYLPKPGQT